jgi:hypothetical protein
MRKIEDAPFLSAPSRGVSTASLCFAAAMAVVIGAGCSPQTPSTVKNAETEPASAAGSGGTPETGSAPLANGDDAAPKKPRDLVNPLKPDPSKPLGPNGEPAKPDPKEVAAQLEELAEKAIPRQSLVIAPANSGDWKPSSLKAPQIGSQMDQAFTRIKPAMVEGRITFDTKVGTQVGKPRLRIGEKGKFNLEFFVPSEPGRVLRYVGDGAKRSEFDGEKWKPISAGRGALSQKEIDAWPQDFPREMLSYFAEGRSVWQPLLASWAKTPSNRLEVQERTDKFGGETRKIFRILSSKRTQQGDLVQELVIDGSLWLPVTIRSELTPPKGKKEAMMWTGRWAFGGAHEEGTFEIPKAR